jgi:NCS2 family nucleobase:cation symporter-2
MQVLLADAVKGLNSQLQRVAAGKIGAAKATKPASIIYGVNDLPPTAVTVSNAIQQVAVIAINLVYPIVIFRAANASTSVTSNLLAVAMVVLAFGTFLQALRLGPVGSGYMCPSTFTATYFGPSLLAARAGGLPLVFGMTLFAGLFEAAVAPILNRLRGVFPPEISGLVIFMIGWSAGIAGLRIVLGADVPAVDPMEWAIAALTLAMMVACNVWGRGLVRMTAALIGLAVGYLAAGITGILDHSHFSPVLDAPWLGHPHFYMSWSFDPALILPFAIASIAAAMKAAGTITICQRSNDATWVRPDLRSVTRGVLADGLSTTAAGFAGAVGTNTSTPGVGVAVASGVTSRPVAFAAGALFLLLAFCPKLTSMLAIMPRSIIVPALLFTVTFIMINGFEIMTSRLLDARRTLSLGLAIVGGCALEVFPTIATSAPSQLSPIVGSSLVFATVVALALNLLFRIGVSKTARLRVERDNIDPQSIETFFQRQAATWGARPDIVPRAIFAVIQLVEAVADTCWYQGPLLITGRFDEFNLDLSISYLGSSLEFPRQRPTLDQIRDENEGARLLAGYLLRQNADQIRSEHKDGQSMVHFHFDH